LQLKLKKAKFYSIKREKHDQINSPRQSRMKGNNMMTMSLKRFKQNAKIFLEQSRKNREPIFLENKADGFVLLQLDDYNSLMETLYLLQSDANARRLQESIRQADNGQLIPFETINEKFGIDAQRA
jgi:antitoxin YefM